MTRPIPAAGEAMPKVTKEAMLDALSFIKKNTGKGGGYNYWADVPAGASYSEDTDTGARLANEFIAFIGELHTNGNGVLLGSIMLAMEENGATRGHKIGFMNTVNKYAMAGGYLAASAESRGSETPMEKANRLAWELAQTLNDYGDGEFKAVVYPTSVRPKFAVGFGILDLPQIKDPLADAIKDYRDGLARMNAIPIETVTPENEAALTADAYGPHLDTLTFWDKPALTRQTAIEALKLMGDQKVFIYALGEPLRLAVLRYLENLEGTL